MQVAFKNIFRFSQVGFVGLGNMGFPMAINLAKKGHQVFAFDIDHSKAEEAHRHGITFRKEVKQVAKDASVFVTMLPNSEHSQSVCESEGGTVALSKDSSGTRPRTRWSSIAAPSRPLSPWRSTHLAATTASPLLMRPSREESLAQPQAR